MRGLKLPVATLTATRQERMREIIFDPDQAIAELCRRFLTRTVKEFWECVSTDELKWNWHMDVMCEELEAVAYRVAAGLPNDYDLATNVPPGTTKSIIHTIVFPVWCWMKWPWMKFITASYSSSLSLDHATLSRDIIRSEKFQRLFPNYDIKQDKDAKGSFQIVVWQMGENKKPVAVPGGSRYSTSVGGTFDSIIRQEPIDDDHLNPEQAASEVELEKANRFCNQTLSTRKTNKEVSTTIMVMQRLHQNDPTGNILDNPKRNVRHICLPGEIDAYREQVSPPELADRYIDGLLDPVRMSRKVLEGLEAVLGQYGYAGQIGQNPVPPGGGMFHVDCLQVVTSIPSDYSVVESIRSWDKAATADAGAYTVGVEVHRLRNGKFLIADLKRGRWSTDKREAIIKSTAEADGPSIKILIEQEPGSGGKESAEATVRNLAGYSVEVERPTGDKVFRADPCSVQVNAGNVLMLHGEWNHDLVEELRFFPFGKYKDIVDSLSAAINKLARRKKVRSLLRGV